MKPSELLHFKECLFGQKGDLDCWLECNNEADVREAINALVAESRLETIEEAANVCLERAANHPSEIRENEADGCAAAIRRLAEEAKEQEGKE